MAEALQETAERIERMDPRIRRTRHLLQEALERLLRARSLEEIAIADVAAEATLNRATFYDHYADKFALLEALVETRFQEQLVSSGIVFDGTCAYALQGIALATCHYLAALPGIDCPQRRHVEKHFESAMMAVIRNMILSGIRQHAGPSSVPPELVAATLAGAIYSGAREWVRTPGRGAALEAATLIFSLVAPILGPVTIPHSGSSAGAPFLTSTPAG